MLLHSLEKKQLSQRLYREQKSLVCSTLLHIGLLVIVLPCLVDFSCCLHKSLKGWWTASEIQNTRLRANIAVFSACQTGLGKVHDAGIIGLTRAFQLAGVPRVVMSLWSVDDQATNMLMQTFVKHLENYIPSEALRQAMLEARKDYPKPSEWASFLLFGTPR